MRGAFIQVAPGLSPRASHLAAVRIASSAALEVFFPTQTATLHRSLTLPSLPFHQLHSYEYTAGSQMSPITPTKEQVL